MSVLAVLTPPFLMCAVVVVAVVTFLRHEMRRGRPDRRPGAADNSGTEASAMDQREHDESADSGSAVSVQRDD